MTENEIRALFDKLSAGMDLTNEEMIALARNTGYMSGQFKRMEVSVDSFAKNIKKAGDELPGALLNAAGAAAKSLGGVAKSLGEADTGFKALTPIIDSVANALSKVPYVGFAFQAAAEASKFMINQLQNATDAFQEVSKVGGLTARGMSGLQDQFLRSGMQLKSYTKTITDNSAALANFAGNVGAGAEKFSQVAESSREFREGLMRLGFQIDELGEYQASYIARQTQLGMAQGKSNSQLALGAAEYAKELDLLSKVTGANRKEVEKQQNAALSESRFRAQYDEMVANGQEKQAKSMLDFQSIVNNIAPELAQGLRDVSTGFTNSDAAIKLFNTTNGKGQEIMARLQSGQIDQSQAYKELQSAVQGNIETNRFQAKTMGDNSVFTKYSESSKLLNSQVDSMGNLIKQQNEQTSDKGDKLTNQTVSAQAGMQKLSIEIQKLGFDYMPAAATAVNGVTKALNYLVKSIAKDTGTAVPAGFGGGGTTKAMSPRQAALEQRRQEAEAAALSGQTPAQQAAAKNQAANPPGPTAALGAGPAFSRPDDTRADKVQLTLEEIREELKKLVKVGGIPGAAAGGQQAAQAALTEHDHAHPHPPSADVSPELSAKIGTLVAPLEKMNQTSGFIRNDGKTMHGAVDLAGKIGDKVMAPISGMAKVLSDPKGYGNYVEVTDTITGVKHILAHLDKTMIKTGDMVKAGQQVGTVGNTGMSTGPHLHHEIKLPDGTRVDPNKFYAGAARQPGTPGAPSVAGAPGGATDMATYMKTVAMLESGGNPNAKAGSSNGNYSSAGGLFQFLESSYEGVTGRKGSGAERYDPVKATEAMQKLTMMNKGQMEKGLGRGVSGEDLYMGHFLGAGGATKFLKAKDQDPNQSAAKFDPAAAASNKSIYYDQKNNNRERSVAEVHSLMTEKYRKQQAAIQSGQKLPDVVAGLTGTGTLAAGTSASPTASTLATPTAPVARPSYASATAGLAGQGQDVISSGLSAITTALFGGSPAGAAGGADAGVGGSEAVALLSQLVALSRDQNSNLSKILSASTA